jgi:hypothetical protein
MKRSELRKIIKEELSKLNEEPIGKIQMNQIRKIDGLEDFLWFKHTLDTKTIRRASMEEQNEWSQVTKELDDVLERWVRLILELDMKYPS